MRFESPQWLLLLGVIAALAAAYLVMQRRRGRYAVRFTSLDLLDQVAPDRPGWRRHLPAVALLAALAFLVVALARPSDIERVPRERATVMVAVDTSGSMDATDVPPSRLDAAKEAARRFVEDLPPRFNVGVVVFAGGASVLVPPSTDREAVLLAVQRIRLGSGGTAIGEGVLTALNAITALDAQAPIDPPPARIVLLSDGANTRGAPPGVAAEAAAEARVPVSTIAYGTPSGRIVAQGQLIAVPVDAPALERLANATEGSFHRAESAEELRDVYDEIGSSVGYHDERRDVSRRFVALGLLGALAAAAFSLLWFSRLP